MSAFEVLINALSDKDRDIRIAGADAIAHLDYSKNTDKKKKTVDALKTAEGDKKTAVKIAAI
ncbi:MAG TPA: hypothetical protein DCL49_05985, partial [Candidatus Omnitrophica bacterium]|nr:hypothetical protein [Candidatus Omnitrophota bacterium]